MKALHNFNFLCFRMNLREKIMSKRDLIQRVNGTSKLWVEILKLTSETNQWANLQFQEDIVKNKYRSSLGVHPEGAGLPQGHRGRGKKWAPNLILCLDATLFLGISLEIEVMAQIWTNVNYEELYKPRADLYHYLHKTSDL